MSTTRTRATPGPIPPTDAEREAWNALTREEQIERFQEYLSHPDCDRVTDSVMSEILAEARARASMRRG